MTEVLVTKLSEGHIKSVFMKSFYILYIIFEFYLSEILKLDL